MARLTSWRFRTLIRRRFLPPLLDQHKGGRFQLAPVFCEDAQHKQLYLPDTNVLLSRFLSAEGVAEISDFMPIENVHPCHDIVRRAKTVRGEVCFRMVCAPRFGYGRAEHRIESHENEVIFYTDGQNQSSQLALRLRLTTPYSIEDGAVVSEFTLRAGETVAFILEQARPGEDSPSVGPNYVASAFKETVNFWQRWANRSTYQGRWREMVSRSALTLKLLTSIQHGFLGRRPNVWIARGNRWGAQLGLSLHLDSGRLVYPVRLDAARLYRRSRRFHEMD